MNDNEIIPAAYKVNDQWNVCYLVSVDISTYICMLYKIKLRFNIYFLHYYGYFQFSLKSTSIVIEVAKQVKNIE